MASSSNWAGGAGGLPPPGAIPASKMNPNMKPGMRPFVTNNGQTGYYQIPMPTPWGGAGPMGGQGSPMAINNPYGRGMPIPQYGGNGMGGMMGGGTMPPSIGPQAGVNPGQGGMYM